MTSLWSAPPAAAPGLTSRDGKTGMIIAGLRGTDAEYAKTARQIVDQLPHDRDGVVVRGRRCVDLLPRPTNKAERDLRVDGVDRHPGEFRRAGVGIRRSFCRRSAHGDRRVRDPRFLAVLRIDDLFTDVSVFAMNLTVAMGLALAVDYHC